MNSLNAHKISEGTRHAPASHYNDPIYDGPSDPVLSWNREEERWRILYTTILANILTVDVSAYIFYFTSPGTKSHLQTLPENLFYDNHETAIQMASLTFENSTLRSGRDHPFDFGYQTVHKITEQKF